MVIPCSGLSAAYWDRLSWDLLGALCLNRVKNNVAKNMFRIFAIIPWGFPAIATAMTWKWLLNGIYGFIPTMMKDLGLTEG